MTEFLGIFWGSKGAGPCSSKLILLPFVALAIFFLIKNYKKTKIFVSAIAHEKHINNILLNFSFIKQVIKLIANITAIVFLFLAILQPQWHKKEHTIEQEGRDLLIMLDISRSMLAQDLKPNRLEFIKLKIKALLQKLTVERVGLILFSGSAFVQCPLTTDYATFLMFLDQVNVENIASGTTAIDAAIRKAIETYRQHQNHKNKLALLVTDGEDFSLNLQSIKQQAKQENIKIFALGAATEQGAPIPKVDSYGKQVGHETNEKGNVVLSKLNEGLLQGICSELNGRYVRATYDDSDLDYIVGLVAKFEKEKFGDKRLSLYEDQYPWFLGVSWFMLAFGWVI